MFHYGKTPHGDLEISASGEDVRMLYRAMSGTGLLERRDMYDLKAYIEDNFREELGLSNPVGAGPVNGGKEGYNGDGKSVQG